MAISPSGPVTVEAAGLRALAPDRRPSAASNSNASPADVEEEEEEDTDENSVAQVQVPAFPATETQTFEQMVVQPMQQTVPSYHSVVQPMQQTLPSYHSVPLLRLPDALPPQAVVAALPQLPLTGGVEAPLKVKAPQDLRPSATIVTPKVSNISFQSKPPANWPPESSPYDKCDPPCIQGRGICNDNVCFCRSPFTGSTCQHKVKALYRASKVMVVGFAAICFLLGMVLARLVMAFFTAAAETKAANFGPVLPIQEIWMPPDKKKETPHS